MSPEKGATVLNIIMSSAATVTHLSTTPETETLVIPSENTENHHVEVITLLHTTAATLQTSVRDVVPLHLGTSPDADAQ